MNQERNAESGSPVEVGSVWRRNPPGSEVVEVRRVWDYSALGDPAVPTVRAHAKHGGRPLVAPVEWFLDRYTRVTSPAGCTCGWVGSGCTCDLDECPTSPGQISTRGLDTSQPRPTTPVACGAQYGQNPDLCYHEGGHPGPHSNRYGTTWTRVTPPDAWDEAADALLIEKAREATRDTPPGAFDDEADALFIDKAREATRHTTPAACYGSTLTVDPITGDMRTRDTSPADGGEV